MKKVAVIGAGKVGEMIADLLLSSDDYHVTVIDASETQLARLPEREGLETVCLNVSEEAALLKVLPGHYAVISAVPYFLTVTIAGAAKAAGVHYLDLTEDVASTREVQNLATSAKAAFIPQCGLAPGFISIVANHLASRMDEIDTINLRVGALPQFPSNSLNYNLTWSTEGVINEYCEPCIALVDGKLTEVPALEQLEHFSLDGIRYESFNTSGGLGTLGETLSGKARNIKYQSVRYPGHRDIMKTLLQDLRLSDRRDVLKDILEHAIPTTLQDVVLIYVAVSGTVGGRLMQETYANKIYSRKINGHMRSAIQITTAASVCAVVDLLRQGVLPDSGYIKQEDIALDDFLANRFGKNFQQKTGPDSFSS